jgi:hypothetical protein
MGEPFLGEVFPKVGLLGLDLFIHEIICPRNRGLTLLSVLLWQFVDELLKKGFFKFGGLGGVHNKLFLGEKGHLSWDKWLNGP